MPKFVSREFPVDAFRFGHDPLPDWWEHAVKTCRISLTGPGPYPPYVRAEPENVFIAGGDWVVREGDAEAYDLEVWEHRHFVDRFRPEEEPAPDART